jgi:hypothetical protein
MHMERLTFSAEAELSLLAQRFCVAPAAVRTALDAVVQGSAKMAQFECPELGGLVQWIRGGRAMLSDSAAPVGQEGVTALCEELARLVESTVVYDPRPSAVDARVGAGGVMRDGARMGESRRHARSSWYPDELGTPSASGGQNGMHYAVFPTTHRLAIDRVGRIDVYDTLDHRIFAVQQDADGSVFELTFTSEHGTFRLDGLPRVGPARPERDVPHGREEDTMGDGEQQEKLKRFQGSQGSGGSYGTGGGFEGDGPSAPARAQADGARNEAGQGRPEVQGEFGGDVGPDGEPIEGPPTRGEDAEQGYTQTSGYPQSGGSPAKPAPAQQEKR